MRKILAYILLLFLAQPAGAVLKEKDLGRTLGVLRAELENNYKTQKQFMLRYEQGSTGQHAELVQYMKQSEQVGLMLYSQKADFTFDVAYACQQATDLYQKLHKTNIPYVQIKEHLRGEVSRYDALIRSLQSLPPVVGGAAASATGTDSAYAGGFRPSQDAPEQEPYLLGAAEQADRDTCLLYAKALRNNMVRMMNAISADSRYYDYVSRKVEQLNDYAQARYAELQKSIFVNGGDNYFSMLAGLRGNLGQARRDVGDKYLPLRKHSSDYSDWRGPFIMGISLFMLFYILLASALSNIVLRWLVPKRFRTASFRAKRPVLLVALGVLIFAVSVMLMQGFIDNNFVLMASDLMINMAWLWAAVFVSLLIRLDAGQIRRGVALYMPFMCMAFLVIVFRIVLIPNALVNIVYPPLLVVFTFWQGRTLRKCRKMLPESDMLYSIVSLAAMVAGCVVAWAGYVLLAVEVMVWWMFQLAAIQTITCCYDLMRMYEARYVRRKVFRAQGGGAVSGADKTRLVKRIKAGDFITATWLYDLVNRALVPILGVASVLLSIWWAADVFEMTAICRDIFFYNFIDQAGVVQVSLYKLCLVVACWFVFRYINYVARSLYHLYKERRRKPGENLNFTLANNVIAIGVWGAYFLYALVLLQVPKSGISVVTAGLATGLGFAMKDLLENFFYGISLMTGRVRVGDYIECDGIQGKVETITYQSTQVVTLDGSVIAFLNTQLFNKNFKNLTRNHSYEQVKIPVGIAYGTDVGQVRRLLIAALEQLRGKNAAGLDIMHPHQPVKVVFSDFGESSVDLVVAIWVRVEDKAALLGSAKEIIYNTLNENGIEIPYPQRDVRLRRVADGVPPQPAATPPLPAAGR